MRVDLQRVQNTGTIENMRVCEHESRSVESSEHRDNRLQNMRVHAHEQRSLKLDYVKEHTLYTKSALKSIRTFHANMTTCSFSDCVTCNESFPSMNASQRTECTRCTRDKKEPKLYSTANGMDPGLVPPELQGLTQVEEMLISSVMSIMSLYHLPHVSLGIVDTLSTCHKILLHLPTHFHVVHHN